MIEALIVGAAAVYILSLIYRLVDHAHRRKIFLDRMMNFYGFTRPTAVDYWDQFRAETRFEFEPEDLASYVYRRHLRRDPL